jgi:hypothetical protein
LNKEELIAKYDEMKKLTLTDHLLRVDAEILRYKKEKEFLRDWYDSQKAQL